MPFVTQTPWRARRGGGPGNRGGGRGTGAGSGAGEPGRGPGPGNRGGVRGRGGLGKGGTAGLTHGWVPERWSQDGDEGVARDDVGAERSHVVDDLTVVGDDDHRTLDRQVSHLGADDVVGGDPLG